MTWFGGKENGDVGGGDENVGSKVEEFLQESPQSVYLIDGPKNGQKSTICRTTETGKSCLNLSISGIALFKTMQGKNYFCSLPPDIDSTHFECRTIT